MRTVIIQTISDLSTLFIGKLADNITSMLTSYGHQVSTHKGLSGLRRTLVPALHQHHYDLLVYLGHGNDEFWYAPLLGPVLLPEDVHLLDGTAVFSIACHGTANLTGPLLQAGAPVVYGSTDAIYVSPPTWLLGQGDKYLKIWTAQIQMLCEGLSFGQMARAGKHLWRDLAAFMASNHNPFDDDYVLQALRNADRFQVAGDASYVLPGTREGT